ncbi:MAG TPA: 50S ribosomal protein L24 [Elusimicrobia bacterium]|nr:50S ribosomal protein L24 [Elusimicrobiota bacterium]HBT62422.1 50S ribosomal protein L24 [Elusimicrobiota bacterium]
MKLKLRKKDKVMVIAGKDKGKTGEVLKIYPDKLRILVGKINIVTKHEKPRQNQPGGLQKMEAAIAYSNVMLVCPKCEKPVRPKLDKLATGESVRICRRCGETIL